MRRELRLRLAALWTDRGTMVRAFDWDQGVTDEPHAASPDPAPPGTGPGRRAGARARAPCAWRRQSARLGALPDDLPGRGGGGLRSRHRSAPFVRLRAGAAGLRRP